VSRSSDPENVKPWGRGSSGSPVPRRVVDDEVGITLRSFNWRSISSTEGMPEISQEGLGNEGGRLPTLLNAENSGRRKPKTPLSI